MRPANGRVSASSLQTWEECPAKYHAEYVSYIPKNSSGMGAANSGTALHYALEKFVGEWTQGLTEWDNPKRLIELYGEGWKTSFGTNNINEEIFKDGCKILKKWLKRTDLTGKQVLSLEKKSFIDITDPNGNSYGIQLTYIFDRCDFYTDPDTGKKILKVTDYKSYIIRRTHEDMQKMLQPLIYATASLIEYQSYQPDEIWVVLDLLRHDETVGMKFTRADCVRGWTYLQKTVEDILASDENNPEYRLGSGCRFCPIKATCPELQKNSQLGGSFGNLANADISELVKLRDQYKATVDAYTNLLSDCDEQIFQHAKEHDASAWETDEFEVKLTTTGRRKITDMELVAKILGPEIMEREGKINVTDIDRLEKDGQITKEQAQKVQVFVEKQYGAPSIKVTKRQEFE